MTNERYDEIKCAAKDVVEILIRMPSPQYAAAVLAFVRAALWTMAGAGTPDQVQAMMDDDNRAAFLIWEIGKDTDGAKGMRQ